jgi:hypothetical protein
MINFKPIDTKTLILLLILCLLIIFLLYYISLSNILGSFRECFSTTFQLGQPSSPIRVTKNCDLQRTQGDPASSIRACICTSNFCNDVNPDRNSKAVSKPTTSTTPRTTPTRASSTSRTTVTSQTDGI